MLCFCVLSENEQGDKNKESYQLSFNISLIKALCEQYLIEDKQKVQNQIVDVLALLVDSSKDKNKTLNLL